MCGQSRRGPDHMAYRTRRVIAASLKKLNKQIAAEWRHIGPELKRCLKVGDYHAEQVLRSRASERQRELVDQWKDFRITLPPFMTKGQDHYVMHPVTPDNIHLLSPHSYDLGATNSKTKKAAPSR